MKGTVKKFLVSLTVIGLCVSVHAQSSQGDVTISARFETLVPGGGGTTSFEFRSDGRLTVRPNNELYSGRSYNVSGAGINYATYYIKKSASPGQYTVYVTWWSGVTTTFYITEDLRLHTNIGVARSNINPIASGRLIIPTSRQTSDEEAFVREQLRIGYKAAAEARPRVEAERAAAERAAAESAAAAERAAADERRAVAAEAARIAALPITITIVNNTGRKIKSVYVHRPGDSMGTNRINTTGILGRNREITFQVPRREISTGSGYVVTINSKPGIFIDGKRYSQRNVTLTHENRFVFTESHKQ